ncbi:MAG: glycosyl transferase family protein [Candidatus Thiodiazotropha lotti]|nr:glycosyl transferase family protein [Candidatus Thiodiazotropha lotti]
MHPFAKYIQILGKGKNGMRPLTRSEAYEAMNMITCYDVEPEQIGAFMMLMRVKEETAEEVAGFVQALKESLPINQQAQTPAIDWAAYAGKKRQLPWFLLAALILARRGYPVLMHGMSRSDERVYVPEALDALDMSAADSMRDAEQQLSENGFAYIPISKLSPLASQLIATRELFGLRPPLHTVVRMLNPLSAPLSLMGVFHPNFATIHQQAAQMLGLKRALICKGEGGEFERIPDRTAELNGLSNGKIWLESWPNLSKPGLQTKQQRLNLNHYRSVWDGEIDDHYGRLAVTGTLALVIRALGLVEEPVEAHRMAETWWQTRHQADAVFEAAS